MAIDGSTFLMMAGALAAGGVGGWVMQERASDAAHATREPNVALPPATAAPPPGPIPVDVVEAASSNAVTACDDSVGAAGECPSVGPADEGVCANLIQSRCGDFKAAFKPKVAERAVACLRQLKGNERCDPARINRCGHAALMAACPEPAPPLKGTLQPANANQPASVTLTREGSAASPLTQVCENLVKSCGAPLSPTVSDCRQTLTGMNETGRASMVECVTTHCAERGLLGCEAVKKAPLAQAQ